MALVGAVLAGAVVIGIAAALVHALSEPRIDVAIAKWRDGHAAAISITYDSGSPDSEADRRVQAVVVAKGVHLDYEVVTANYASNPELAVYLRDHLVPRGFGFFGHGHRHVDHDQLSYDDALASFRACHDAMLALGLTPIAYAYPSGAGRRRTTRRALADAGFLSGRMHDTTASRAPFIVPDGTTVPRDWYKLPSLVMQDRRFAQCEPCVSGTSELVPLLDGALQHRAWIITTYHAIGDPTQWGWYSLTEFATDMDAIAGRDFWNASLNAVTLYVRERASASIRAIADPGPSPRHIRVELSDRLPPAVPQEPLTIVARVPPTWNGAPVAVTHRGVLVAHTVSAAGELQLALVPDGDPYDLTLAARPVP